jgi:hypothetical protein
MLIGIWRYRVVVVVVVSDYTPSRLTSWLAIILAKKYHHVFYDSQA